MGVQRRDPRGAIITVGAAHILRTQGKGVNPFPPGMAGVWGVGPSRGRSTLMSPESSNRPFSTVGFPSWFKVGSCWVARCENKIVPLSDMRTKKKKKT